MTMETAATFFFGAWLIAFGVWLGRQSVRRIENHTHLKMDDEVATRAIQQVLERHGRRSEYWHAIEKEYWQRGATIAKLSRRLGKTRARAKIMRAALADFRADDLDRKERLS